MSIGGTTDLRWEDILPPLARAEDRLARLDETLKTSPLRDGFLARTHYLDAIASLALEGELVHLEDLILADADMAVRAPSHELVRAQAYLSTRRQIADTDAGWIFAPASAHRLQKLGRGAGQGTDDADDASTRHPTSSISSTSALDAGTEDDLEAAFAALDNAVAKTQSALATPTPTRPRTPLISEVDREEGRKFDQWRDGLQQTMHLPPTLAAALTLVDWDNQQPLSHRPWLGRLIVAAHLRHRGKTQHLPCLSIGLRAIPPRQRQLGATATPTQRVLTQLEAIAAGAEAGLADHARWLSARAGLLRKIAGRRSSSRLPDLVELVMKRGVVSGGMVAEELCVSTRAALDLIEALGLRETTGRGRYRAWGVL